MCAGGGGGLSSAYVFFHNEGDFKDGAPQIGQINTGPNGTRARASRIMIQCLERERDRETEKERERERQRERYRDRETYRTHRHIHTEELGRQIG